MSAGKNPYLRYQIIDQCLSSKSKSRWKALELIDKFAAFDLTIELRTLKKDIKDMRENSQLNYNAPIKYDKKDQAYHYAVEGYSIYGERLSQNDLLALAFYLNMMEQWDGSGLLEDTKRIVNKLSKANKVIKTSALEDKKLLHIQHPPFYKGIGYVHVLVDSIFHAQPLCITYRKFGDEASANHVFHPYQLKLYDNRWYVRGYSGKRKEVIILALDRIESIKEEPVNFRHDDAPSEKDYFAHTIGITKGQGPVEEIVLAFTPEQGHYIKTLHLHHTQKILKDDNTELIISLQLIQNYELCQVILRYMPNVAVMEPKSLRDKIVEMLKKGLERNA